MVRNLSTGRGADNRGGPACVGEGYLVNLCNFHSNCFEPKTALKNKSSFNFKSKM